MKSLFTILFFMATLFVSGQKQHIQNISVLASQYYQNKEYAKAAELYEQLYAASKSQGYFTIYLDCLMNIPDFEKAEKEIRKGMRGNDSESYWYVQWGFLKKAMGQPEESRKLYDKAIGSLSNNPVEYSNLSNQFISRREFDYAEKVYLKARIQNPGMYNYELARIYYYLRNYNLMMKEYLDWIDQKEANIEIVKSNLQSVLVMDNDHEISKQLKTFILKRIQQEPEQIGFNRLLIWLFIQDKNFVAAIRQSIALDKRTGAEDVNIYGLANVAVSNKDYVEAKKAYDYLIAKGEKASYFNLASQQLLQMEYDRFLDGGVHDLVKANELKARFAQTFSILGKSIETVGLITEQAHLHAFYLNDAPEAIRILLEGSSLPGISVQQKSALKEELSDVYVYSGDLWEAVITYSQVIESNKSNDLGDDVKFKKAKLGYYMGNFLWAKAQLNALRASTSKLIANDAMELSLFIGENLDDDSTATPLKIFARADLQLFRNNFTDALATLDTIIAEYPYISLTDDVNFRKADIFQKQGKYEEAVAMLESIVKDNGTETLADDALFQLAGIYLNKLNQKEKAMELYKKMLTDYPGSVYVVDSRNEYRKIQDELKPNKTPEPEISKEDLFFRSLTPKP